MAPKAEDNSKQVELTTTNYPYWSKKTSASLKSKGFSNEVLGDESVYAYNLQGTPGHNPSAKEKVNLTQAMGILEYGIGKDTQFLIDNFKQKCRNDAQKEDPWCFWNFLKEKFVGNKNRARVLKRKLISLTASSPSEAERKIRNIQTELTAIAGQVVSAEDLKLALLDSLEGTTGYQMVVTALRLEIDAKSFEDLLAALQLEETRIEARQSLNDKSTKPNQVFFTKNAREVTNNRQPNFQRCRTCGKTHKQPCRHKSKRCRVCNKVGHLAQVCRARNNTPFRGNPYQNSKHLNRDFGREERGSPIKCQICKKPYHSARDCRFRYEKKKSGNNKQSYVTQTGKRKREEREGEEMEVR